MATLLTIGLAGMVSGQPTQNNSNDFGVSPATRLGPLEMPFTDQTIADFQSAGELSSEIKLEYRDAVNEIVFFYDDANQNQSNANSVGVLQPIEQDKANETLVFEMDSFDLERIKKGGVHYKFDPVEIGQYSRVVVYYNATTGQQSIGQRITSGRETDLTNEAPRRDRSGLGGGQVERSASNNVNEPSVVPRNGSVAGSNGNISQLADPNFMRPPNPYGRDSEIAGHGHSDYNRAQSAQENNQRPLNPLFTTRANANTDLGTSTAGPGNISSRWDFSPVIPRSVYNDQKSPEYPTNDQVANVGANSSNSAELTRLEQLQQAIATRKDQAMARQLKLAQAEVEDLEYENYLKQQDHALRHQELEDKHLSLTQRQRRDSYDTNLVDGNLNDANANNNPFQPAQRGNNYSNQLTNGYQPPARLAANNVTPQTTDNGVSGLRMAIPGPNDENQKQGGKPGVKNPSLLNQGGILGEGSPGGANPNMNLDGPMFFMLLCSLALNIYLGWISRGFYVRYNELADELRETFTATM